MRNSFGKRSILATAIAAAIAAPAVVWAQSADATLRGSAAANSEVTAKNVATGATRRTKAGADGSYTLVGLPPGTYRVDAGPGTETTVTLSVASTANLDLGGTAATDEAPMQEVTVTGRRLNEVRTSEVGSTVSQQQIETVPQIIHNFLEFADTIPGVVFEVDGQGRTSLRGGAQNENGVNVYIDGVGQKGYVRSGLSGQSDDTQGNPFPQLAIGEYKVITSNYKAEYDQISSAAITALTKSGTNEFEGQAFGLYSADNFRARTPGELASGTKTESETKEYGLSFGGPILQDKLHFFVTYEAKRYQTPTTVVAGGNAPPDVVAALPADVLAQLGPATIGFDEDLFFAKLDWEPTDSDRFELSAKVRDETSQGNQIGTGTAASAAVDTDNNDKRMEVSWKHSSDRWFNELMLTYEDAFFNPHVAGGGQNGAVYTYQISPSADNNIIAVDGSDPRAGQNKGQKGWAIGDTITLTDLNWGAGDHTVKAGIKFKKVDLTAQDAVANNPVFYYDTTTAGPAAIPWKAVFALPLAGYGSTVTSADKQIGIFAQDDWEVNDKLTLNLGIRWDLEENPSYLDFKTPQFLLDAFNTEISPGLTYGESLGLSNDPATHLDVNDYISTGNNRSSYKKAFQPRLGFSYDLNGDESHVIFGGVGRAYDRNLYDYLQLEQNKFALAQAELRFNTAEHPCTPSASCVTYDPAFAQDIGNLQALLAGTAGEVDLINNDLKVPYSDQFSVGMRNHVGDWNTSATVSRILSKNGFVFTLGNRYPNGDFWQNRSQPWGNSPPGLAGVLIVGDNGIETKSTQILLSADKPFTEESKWGMTVAYTFTNAKQNRDINEHYAFDQVNINQYPFINSNAASKHRVVATGSFQAPWGIMMATKFTWSTAIPRNIGACLQAPNLYINGAPCTALAYTGKGGGYKSLDFQFTKNLDISDLGSMYLRVDLLNVNNEHNLVDFGDVVSADGRSATGFANPDGNITGVPRTVRMSFGVKF